MQSNFVRLFSGLSSLLLASTLSGQQPGTNAQILVPPPSVGRLAVFVRNTLGEPFSGMAVVRLYNPSTRYDQNAPTDGGAAFFDRVPLGNYLIEAHAPGYQMTSEPIEVLNPQPGVPFFVSLFPEHSPASATVADAVALSLSPAKSDWEPPEVDEVLPAVASDVDCSLPHVIEGTGRRVKSLVVNLGRISATENIAYEELNDSGKPTYSENLTMDYIVSFQQVRPNVLHVDESRSPMKSGKSSRRLATKGQAALALIFHSSYSNDYEMTCAGLGQLQGRPVWIVDFRQRPDRAVRVSTYQTRKGLFGLKWKGRAWITANSYQIARLELDLMEPIPEIRLMRDHIVVRYSPVRFEKTDSYLWLPGYFEIYQNFRGRWYHIRHSLSDFKLFSVETTEKVNPPHDP